MDGTVEMQLSQSALQFSTRKSEKLAMPLLHANMNRSYEIYVRTRYVLTYLLRTLFDTASANTVIKLAD